MVVLWGLGPNSVCLCGGVGGGGSGALSEKDTTSNCQAGICDEMVQIWEDEVIGNSVVAWLFWPICI